LKNSNIINDSIGWDVTNWKKAISFWEDELGDNFFQGKTALEIGGGQNGGLSLWLLSKGCDVTFSSPVRISKEAITAHMKWGYQATIKYEIVDAYSGNNFFKKYDIICFKSVLGGISRLGPDAEQAVLKNCYRALNDGGIILFAENLKGSGLHKLFRKHFSPSCGNKWNYFNIEDLISLSKQDYSISHKTFGYLATFGYYESLRTFFAYLDSFIFENFFNRNKHYTVAVILKKKVEENFIVKHS
jgi:SAM-dependent methyltransferase